MLQSGSNRKERERGYTTDDEMSKVVIRKI
jgi:hypothetical protein